MVLLYIPLCITIRSRQVQKMIGRQESREIGNMTLEEAYSIKTRLAEQEFPLVFSAAMASVFFKVTYNTKQDSTCSFIIYFWLSFWC